MNTKLKSAMTAIFLGCSLANPCLALTAFNNFTDTSSLKLNGATATVTTTDGVILRLTPANGNQAGSVFSQVPVNAANFSTFLKFRITESGGMGDGGADGIVFVIQPISSDLGGTGGEIGYGGIGNSVGVEFDTWDNGEISASHIGINLNGRVNHEGGVVNTTPKLDDGNIWFAWIDYDGATLEVRANQTGTRPLEVTLSQKLDLPTILGGVTQAFVGFTSGTGGAFSNHDILSWEYRESFEPIGSPTPVTPPPTSPTVAKTIELCTAIDGSSSITLPSAGGDPLNFQKQVEGLANAIQDPAVFPKDGTVTISVVQFSGSAWLEVSPTLIDSQATADVVATQVRGIQQNSTGTDIGSAINFCTDQFKFTSEKQIIDVSTDGQSDASTAATNAVAKGVDAINALGVGTGVDQAQLNAMVRPQPLCTTTGQTNCGFVSLIRNFDQYAAAIKRKITMETGGTYVADTVECGDTKEALYTVPLGPTGFYIVEAALPTDQPPGVWSLLVDTMSTAPFRSRGIAIPYPGGFYAGVALRENGLSPSWVGFSVAETEAVEMTVSDFLKNHSSFDLTVIQKVGESWLTIFRQPSAVPEQPYTTPPLWPGFYAVVVTGDTLSPRGQLGMFVKGNTLYGAVTGGWIDHAGGGYSAFSVGSPGQVADVKLLFCDSYGEAGAGKPAVQMLYVKGDGTKEVFWKAE